MLEAVPPYRLRTSRSLLTKSLSIDKAKPFRTGWRQSHLQCVAIFRELRPYQHLVVLIIVVSLSSCTTTQKQIGIPGEAQATLDAVIADIAAEQDEKIYREADDEWRRASTLDETKEFFKTLRMKLGKVRTRSFHSARGEQNAGSESPGQSFVVQYQTSFERADGMETFTLVGRNGRWFLARYFVNSEALK